MVIESNHHSSDNLETVCLLGEQKAVADLSAELNEIKGTPEADRKGAAEDHSDQRLALIQKENELAALRVKSERMATVAEEWRSKYEEELGGRRPVGFSPGYQMMESSSSYGGASLSKDQSKSLALQRIRARSARRRAFSAGSRTWARPCQPSAWLQHRPHCCRRSTRLP